MMPDNELYIPHLLKSLNGRRILNLFKTGSSFLLSALLQKNILWGRPTILTVEPTNTCNLRCPLCTTGNGEMTRQRGNMSLEVFQTILDKMGKDIFFLLLYHQGEPYLNSDFLKMVQLAKKYNIYCTTSTNGHYFTEETIWATIDSGLDSMIVSLDGTTQDVYEQYRVRGDIHKVIEGTRRFMQIRKQRKKKTPLIALQFLVMKQNEHQLPTVRKLAEELGVDRLLIKNIEVRSLEEAKIWLPVNDKFRRYKFDGRHYEVKNNNKKSCPRPWLSTLINWDGSMVPCCFDKNGQYEMGNIVETESFQTLWRGTKFEHFRQQLASNRKQIEMCRNCNQGLGSFIPEFRVFQRKKAGRKPAF